MRMLESCGTGGFCRRRQYVGKYLVGIGVAAALMALSAGWLLAHAAAQTNDPPDNSTLSVEECLGKADSSVGSTGVTLAKEGVIEKNLLSTPVTDDMCGDILKRAQNGGQVQALVAAQNYIQEIKLIEDSIHKGAGEATAGAGDRRLYGDVSLVSATVGLQANKGPAQGQYHDRETPSGGGGNGPRVKGVTRAAANVSETAAGVVADGDGSITDMFERVEAVALSEGLSRSEADYSARCGLETALLNAISKELTHRRYIKVSPAPKEIEYGHTVTVKLLVSGDVSGLYEKLEGQYGEVARASGTEEGCVGVVESMKARLSDRSFEVEPHQGKGEKRITHDTAWRWDITANTQGKNSVDLFVGHVLRLGEMELVPHWVEPSPVRHATITVKQEPLRARFDLVGRNWPWLVPGGIALAAAATWLVWMLRRREHDR